MVAYNKFEVFVFDLASGFHDFGATPDLIEVYLATVASAPSTSADEVKTDVAEIAGGNGYTAGGIDVTPVGTETTGTFTLAATDVTVTCDTAAMAEFQYVVLFNDTPAAPLDPLIAWWDRGAGLTLQVGESFTIDFQSDQIFTLV